MIECEHIASDLQSISMRRLQIIISRFALGTTMLAASAFAQTNLGIAGPVCAQLVAAPLQLVIPTGPLALTELGSCDERALYYGFEKAADPAAALQCALFQRANPRPEMGNPFYGPVVYPFGLLQI